MEEVFKTIPGHPKYAISPTGRVLSYSTGIIRKPYKNPKDGYWRITLYDGYNQRSTIEIHRLVAEAWIPKPDGYEPNWQVNHISHNKDDNSVPNLEWVSPSENMRWDYTTNYRDIDTARYIYTYEISKDGEVVAIVKGMTQVSKVVGLSETRCAYACKLGIPTSTGYIIKAINKEPKNGFQYAYFDVYKDGELIAEHLRPDEAEDLTGVSYRSIRHSAQYNKPVKQEYLFVRNKKN